jgi:hypothetical protein
MKRKASRNPSSVELLESRIAPAAMTFTVTTTADSGAGSLRQAILDANANTGVDEIDFSISGSGVHTILVGKTSGIGQISSALPAITEGVVIDGTTQPGFTGALLIGIDGANAPLLSNGLSINAAGVTVKGLAITHFNGSGLSITGTGAIVQGNNVGVDATGNAAANATGITILGAGAQIGGAGTGEGNTISGNTGDGIRLTASTATVTGNVIGLSPVLDVALANGGAGVNITSGGTNIIGGAAAGARNVISGNTGAGVAVTSSGIGNLIQGNFIGLDEAGDHARPNGAAGVNFGGLSASDSVIGNFISGNADAGIVVSTGSHVVTGNVIGLDFTGAKVVANGAAGIDLTGPGNTIGGTGAASRNVISGNTTAGVYLHGSNATGNTVAGNYIGLGPDGVTPHGNAVGVLLDGASSNTIGGATPNVISGNPVGISLNNSASSNSISGNFIGTEASGTKAAGVMTDGILITSSSNNTIGTTSDAPGNTIAFATRDGVRLVSGTGNAIVGNSIFLNGVLGIDLGSDGPTANDGGNPPDGDSGANDLQNFPVLSTSILIANGLIQVAGQLDSTPNSSIRVEFFNNPDFDLYAASSAQGRHFLSSATVATDGNGHGVFTVNLAFSTADGPYITATATGSGGTSEFSDFVATHVPVTLVTDQLAVYHDVDGDPAYVGISKGKLTQENFQVIAEGQGGQLQLLDLAHSGTQFDGAKLVVTSGPVDKGRSGTVNVGRIDATGVPLALVTVGGDLAQIDVGNGVSSIRSLNVLSLGQLGRSTQLPTLAGPDHSSLNGAAGSITVRGNLLGTLEVEGGVKSLNVLGKILGGETLDSGRVDVSGVLGTAKIGALIGGAGQHAGSLHAGSAGTLTVVRSIIGGTGQESGSITADGSIASLTINGDVRALGTGAGVDSASVLAQVNLPKVIIRGDLEGGRLAAGGQLGAVSILGDATGLIAAAGKAAPQSVAEAIAIKSVYVGGTAAHLSIIAGHDFTGAAHADNASVQMGGIKIDGNLYASDIAAGVSAGADGVYGTGDDAAFSSGNSIVSRIASITVLGNCDGTPYNFPGGQTDHFGIVAKQIGAMVIGTKGIGLTNGKDDISIGTTGDFEVREI